MNFIAKRVTTLLHHFRDACDHPESWARMAKTSKLTKVQVEELQELKCLYTSDLRPTSTVCASSSAGPLPSAAASSSASAQPVKKARVLNRNVSAASSLGTFSPIASSTRAQSLGSFSPMEVDSESEHDGVLEEAKGEKRCSDMLDFSDLSDCTEDPITMQAIAAAADPLPAGKTDIKKAVIKKRPAAAVLPTCISAALGPVKLQKAQKKSYILAFNSESRKWQLVVETTHAEHSKIIDIIWAKLQSDGLDKAACVAMRNSIHADGLPALDGDAASEQSGSQEGSESEDSGLEGSRRGDTSSSEFHPFA